MPLIFAFKSIAMNKLMPIVMLVLTILSLVGVWHFNNDPVLSSLCKATALIFMLLIPAQWSQTNKPNTYP